MRRLTVRSGFTLIEVLVVLTVISIVVAISLPVLQRVRERGRNATCQSNIRQLNIALQQYVADNDSTYPNSNKWQKALEPYFKSRQIWECPDEQVYSGIGTLGNTDYTLNSGWLNKLRPTQKPGHNEWLGSIESRHAQSDPTKTWSIYEHQLDGPSELIKLGCPTLGLDLIENSTRHYGGANYGFLDGHVKWLTPQAAADAYCYMQRTLPRDYAPIPSS